MEIKHTLLPPSLTSLLPTSVLRIHILSEPWSLGDREITMAPCLQNLLEIYSPNSKEIHLSGYMERYVAHGRWRWNHPGSSLGKLPAPCTVGAWYWKILLGGATETKKGTFSFNSFQHLYWQYLIWYQLAKENYLKGQLHFLQSNKERQIRSQVAIN